MGTAATLYGMYEAMLAAVGPSHWWPGDTPFEVAVGAILTQNTNWTNVEKAIANLKERDLLDARAMYGLDHRTLAELIKPAGYFNIKAARLKNFLQFLADEAEFRIEDLKVKGMVEAREGLLSVKGIGPETADSILLYALDFPTFVVDAYTFRMFHRHGLIDEEADYHELRGLFMDNLEEDVPLYNEYHALIVRFGKEWCRKKQGLCEVCPLKSFLD